MRDFDFKKIYSRLLTPELMPYITVETPENSFGYIDVFFYDNTNISGHYANRSHPAWITKKIVEVCRKFAENLPYSVY